jgi:FG-GAP-like repeat/Domain of unknown function (DUF4214)/Putative Ig domain
MRHTIRTKRDRVFRQPDPQLSRKRFPLLVERLEERIVLSGTPNPVGLILPLFAPAASPYGVSQPDLPTAEATGFYSLILGRAPDPAGLKFWTEALQGGASPASVLHAFLTSSEYQTALVKNYFQNYLNRDPELGGSSFWSGMLGSDTNTTNLTVGLTTSAEYQQLYSTNDAFVQSLYSNILGRQGGQGDVDYWDNLLAGGANLGLVAATFATSTEALTQSIQSFYQVFFQRVADPSGLSFWVDQARHESLTTVLTQILSTPEFQFQANAGTSGQSFSNFFGFNQQTLTSDPVTDPVASGATGSASLTPMNSPWDQALIFPSVPYASASTSTAPQPTLQLPASLVSSLNLNQDETFQLWFQAKNPGVLLSAAIPSTGDTATGTYPAPLIYINADGNLVAGLFDQTALSVVPHRNPLSWKATTDGPTQIGAAHPLVSQVGVLDNTWHHVALVFSAQSESLYLDGLLQGTSEPQYHQINANLKSDILTLVVPLDQNPSPGQEISGTISQVNPAGDKTFGQGGTTQIYRFQGWLPASGQAALELTSTSGSSAVTGVTYSPGVGNTPASLTFQLSESIKDANALTIDSSYLTSGSAYSFEPASSSTWSTPINTPKGPSSKAFFGTLTNLSVGGTIFTEPTSQLYPATNYPQGFVGSVDDVALWNVKLEQPQVQAAMSGPVLPANGIGGVLPDKLLAYFPFATTIAGTTNEWPNVAPGDSGFASGPTTGTLLVTTSSTIPTDPFLNATRLPGARDWGLDIMTPLASPSLSLASGTMFKFKVGLAAGDQFEIEVPEAQNGSLMLVVEDDLGRVSKGIQLAPNTSQYLPAARTGTYQLTLTWTSVGNQQAGVVNFGLIPGPLNSVMELFASFVQGVSPTHTNTVGAYSDPKLPGINSTVGNATATGAANYWPLWTDLTYFPTTNAYTPTGLNTAYQLLVKALIDMNVGLSDFSNINGASVTDPAKIQQFLDQSYRNAYGAAPPTPPGLAPFPVAPAATPQEAVYEFLFNANLLRQTIYPVLTGQGGSLNPSSLPSWIQGVINSINASAVPENIATTIATGQTQQVHNIPINIFQPSQKQSVGEILLGGLIWAAGGLLAAIPGLGEVVDPVLVLLGAGLGGGGAALGQSFTDNAFSSGAGATSFTVPVTSITNSELNYDNLNDMAVSIQAGALQLWNNILTALTTPALAQSVLSNFGLLKAFAEMSGAPLGNAAATPASAITTSLTRSSWQEMIPATFTWTSVAAYAFPTGNGQTNDWAASSPYSLNGGEKPDLNGITNADFNKDGQLDLAVANFGTSDVSILLGAGGGAFNSATTVSLITKAGTGPDGARGIVSGDFNGDGNADLVISDYSSDVLSILLGDGQGGFQTAQTIDLNGPNGPWGIVSGKFDTDDHLDLAVADFSSSEVSILLGNGDGTFKSSQTIGLNGPDGAESIVSGDFNKDGALDLAVTDASSDEISILLGKGDGSFEAAQTVDLDAGTVPRGIVSGDFNQDGSLDLAVTDSGSAEISVLLGNGDGTFQGPANYPLADGSSGPTGIALSLTVGGSPNLVVTCTASNSVNVFFNRGDGTFLPAINIPQASSEPLGITVADFANDGLGQAAIASKDSNNVVLLSPAGVGNTATFLPGPQTSDPLAGPSNLEKLIDPTALDKLLSQIETLQGGNTAFLGPFDQRGLIAPQMTIPPNFMAFTNLVYPNYNPPYNLDLVPLSLNAPGMFLSLTPATLNETGTDVIVNENLSYTQSGAYLAGWQLLDSNGNPIAPGTLQQLFGTPSVDPNTLRPVGVDLTPVNPAQPFAAYNGGWYFDTKPVSGAAATWADAFFGWGLATGGYSPRYLSPSAPQVGTLPNSTAAHGGFDSDPPVDYMVTFQPATDSPPPAPTFTSAASAIFTEGFGCQFIVMANAAVHPVLSESPNDVLPKGITFDSATGALFGIPAAGSAATYSLHFTASTAAGSVTQSFTLHVYSQSTSENIIQALYSAELGRTGSVVELNRWVAVLGTRGQVQVVNGIAKSSEALAFVATGWFQTYLHRSPGTDEVKAYATLLATQTQEQVLSQILGSPEFLQDVQNRGFKGTPSQNYVQALYVDLLGRTPSDTELADQVAEFQKVGQQKLALIFLQSTEYRTDTVADYYTSLLDRPGGAAEIASWVNSSLDLRAIRSGIESSQEFFSKG